MITLQDFLQAVNYRITSGSEYQWQCFGDHARYLDSEVAIHSASASVIFDSRDQTIYQATAYDYAANRAYRWTHPNWAPKYQLEVADRGVTDNAWDDVSYTDLELAEDMLEKTRAIIASEAYDTRVSIPLTLPDDEMLLLMTMAHEQDMTFNDFVEDLLRKALADIEARAAVEGLDKIREEFGALPKKGKKKGRVPRRTLALELEGVVADVEQGEGFDGVCMKTLKRVIKELTKD